MPGPVKLRGGDKMDKAIVAGVALLAFLPAVANGANLENIFCAAQSVTKPELNRWDVQYSGNLTHVQVTRYYGDTTPRSIITCFREFGVVARPTNKICHLVQGDGRTSLILETVSTETFNCEFKPNSFKDNNDTTCQVVCE